MLFTTFTFTLFFVIVFFLYYFVLKERTKLQNWLLLLSSYFFYGYANWRMIPVILISTFIFYKLGIAIHKAENVKRAALFKTIGIVLGVGMLLYFKYLNFFIESFVELFISLGFKTNLATFNIIIPLGVSYFTFKYISYLIEIYRGKMEPEKDFIAFATYIAFFPSIIAGPIDRPNIFIPQLHTKRIFNYNQVVDGCRQILWGLFKKLVIADNLAIFTDQVWGNIDSSNASTLLSAAILFCVQMYTDFSGYSDMAIGIGKILGFNITKNFNYPFFATNVVELWRRWHISLTSWVTDYVYMPLNVKFRNLGRLGIILAILINMVVIGLWHGANWTYGLFGLYQGLLFVPLIISGSFFSKQKGKKSNQGNIKLVDFMKMAGVFLSLSLGMIVFKAESIGQALEFVRGICSSSILSFPTGIGNVRNALIFSVILFISEWFCKQYEFPLQALNYSHKMLKFNLTIKIWLRWAIYILMIFIIIETGNSNAKDFIYAQF